MNCQGLRICVCFLALELIPVYACAERGNGDSDVTLGEKSTVFSELRNLMDNPVIQSELEISDEQLIMIEEILAQVKKNKANRRSLTRNLPVLDVSSASMDEMRHWLDAHRQISREFFESQNVTFDSLNDILLPHQIKRILQIARQGEILRESNKGLVGILSAPVKLKDVVGLTDKKCEELQPRLDEIESKYFEKLAKLRAETYQAVLDDLDDEQRKKMDTLIGPLFDFEESQRIWYQAQLDKYKTNDKGRANDQNRAKSD